MEINREIASRVLATIDAGLVAGLGNPIPGAMCVEAAVCYALGLPHGDNPESCVAQSVRHVKIVLNDYDFSSPEVRARAMRRLGLAQLGSAGVLDDVEFVRRVVRMTIAIVVPRSLRSLAGFIPSHAQGLEAAAARCGDSCGGGSCGGGLCGSCGSCGGRCGGLCGGSCGGRCGGLCGRCGGYGSR